MPATIGNPLVDRPIVDGWANYYMNFGSGIPNDLYIGSFSCYAKEAGKVQFLIYRLNEDAYSIVGKSEVLTAAVGVNTIKLSSPIEAKAGDIIGWYFPDKGIIAYDDTSDSVRWGDQGGSATVFEHSGGRTYSISISEASPPQPDVPYGTYKIKTCYHKDSGQPAGWGLSAWRIRVGAGVEGNPSDGVRDSNSSWIATHGDEKFTCLWEIKPGRTPDTYRIETKPHALTEHPGGWGLSAFPNVVDGGKRNESSTRIAVHKIDQWVMDWKIIPGRTEGTWRINTTEHVDGQAADWGLASWARGHIKDTIRDDYSAWVYVHQGEQWPTDWALEKQD